MRLAKLPLPLGQGQGEGEGKRLFQKVTVLSDANSVAAASGFG